MHWKCTTKDIFSVHACDLITMMHPSPKQSSCLGRPLGVVFKHQCMSARVRLQVHALWGHGLETMDPVWISSLLIFSMIMMVRSSIGHDVAYTWTDQAVSSSFSAWASTHHWWTSPQELWVRQQFEPSRSYTNKMLLGRA